MSYSDDDEFGPEPAWLDGYTGAQEAKEDHEATVGESTSARLFRVEQELGHTQDALTKTRAERDEAWGVAEARWRERDELRKELDMAVIARQAALHDAVKAVAEADAKREQAFENAEAWHRDWQLAKAELATARDELEQLRGEKP